MPQYLSTDPNAGLGGGYLSTDPNAGLDAGKKKPKLEPGFLERVNSRLPTAGITDVPGALYDLAQNPLTAQEHMVRGLLGTGKAILTSPKASFDQARARGGGLLEASAAAVPVVGQIADTVIQDAVAGRGPETLGNALNLGMMAAVGSPAVRGSQVMNAPRSIPSIPPQVVGAIKEAGPALASAGVDVALGGTGTAGAIIGGALKYGWNKVQKARTAAEKAAVDASIKSAKAQVALLEASEKAAKGVEKAAIRDSIASAKAEVKILEGSKGSPPAPPSVPPSMSSSGLTPAPVAPVAQPRLGTPTATEVPAPATAPKAGPNLADPVQFNKIIDPIKAERGPIPKERLDSVERLANQLTHQTRTALGNRPLTPDEVGAQLRRTFPKYDPAHLDQIAERVRAATPPTMPLERFADLMAQDGVPIMEITTQIKNMYRVSTKEANRAATAAHRSIPKKPKP